MKNLIGLLLFCSVLVSTQAHAQELKSEFLFDLELDVAPPQMVGKIPAGTRMIFPFTGGTVKGNLISGKVLPGGADWGLNIDSTTFKADVRGTIETSDGAIIYIHYTGFLYTDAKKFAIINAGKAGELSPADYYFRTNIMFETSAPKYAWLNHTIAVGVGRIPAVGKVAYRIYAIK
jgi:hypothetical protein